MTSVSAHNPRYVIAAHYDLSISTRGAGNNLRLLIVEDDAALARGMINVFRDPGVAVDHVSNGAKALAIVR
jgi:ActR/RegA family two-component response regulator